MNLAQKSLAVAAAALLLSMASYSSAQAQEGPAYFVVELNVTNQDEFDSEYAGRAGQLVAEHGGIFVVGGREAHTVEGTPPEGVVIIMRFDSMNSAQAFLDSPEYREIAPIRQRTARTRSYLVQAAAE